MRQNPFRPRSIPIAQVALFRVGIGLSLVATSCVGNASDTSTTDATSTEVSSAASASTSPGSGDTSAATATSGPSGEVVSAEFIDPRRGDPLDFEDPMVVGPALMAMVVTPVEIDPGLAYLEPDNPAHFEPGGDPGFWTEVTSLEELAYSEPDLDIIESADADA